MKMAILEISELKNNFQTIMNSTQRSKEKKLEILLIHLFKEVLNPLIISSFKQM